MRVDDLFKFIRARHCVYLMREAGNRKPWTGDPILQKYRFCNVYRELDAVTVWIGDNWRKPYAKNEDLWFAMVVARLFNNVETLDAIKFPVPFNPVQIKTVTDYMKRSERRVFNPAYIVSTNGLSMDKVQYVCEQILVPLWECRKRLRPKISESLASYAERIGKFRGLGSFMVGQIIADLKYVEPLSNAVDWKTWATSGPGSRRGMNRVMGHGLYDKWKEADWLKMLSLLQLEINPLMLKAGYEELHAQDLQNCLCEFDKYERVRLGEGTPKQRYNGGEV